MSSNIIRQRCPQCEENGLDTKGDNLVIRLDTNPLHGHCYSCGYHTTENLGLLPAASTAAGGSQKKKVNPLIPKGSFTDLKSRGISARTCEFYSYSVSKDNRGNWVQVANFINPKTSKLEAQKLRDTKKHFTWLGDNKNVNYLFGQWLFEPNPKLSIVITEGELDCLAYAEGVERKWPCVSVKNGASSAVKELEAAAEWLNGWKKVVLCFDGDEAGRAAAVAVSESTKFKHGKIYIAQLPDDEDVNSLLLKNRFKEVDIAVMRAQSKRLEDIVDPMDYSVSDIKSIEPYGYNLPFPILNERLRGIKSSSLYLLTAGTGLGKSTLAKEIAYHIALNHEAKVGLMFLETNDLKCMKELVALDHDIEPTEFKYNPSLLTDEQVQASLEKMHERFKLYKHFGSMDLDVLLAKMEVMFNSLDRDVVVLDHVNFVVSGNRAVSNERVYIDNIMTGLKELVERTGKTIITICHLNRGSSDKEYHKGASIGLESLRGSGTLGQVPDYVIGLERHQYSGDDSNKLKLNLLKCREGGKVGYTDLCEYNEKTGRIKAIGDATVFDFEEKSINTSVPFSDDKYDDGFKELYSCF